MEERTLKEYGPAGVLGAIFIPPCASASFFGVVRDILRLTSLFRTCRSGDSQSRARTSLATISGCNVSGWRSIASSCFRLATETALDSIALLTDDASVQASHVVSEVSKSAVLTKAEGEWEKSSSGMRSELSEDIAMVRC